MNIIVFGNSLLKGGAELQSIYLSKVLMSRHNVQLVVFNGNDCCVEYMELVSQLGIRLVRLRGNRFTNIFQFAKYIRQNKCECIYSFLATTNVYAALVGRVLGVKYIIGGIRSSRYKGWKFKIQKWIHNYLLDISIANSYSGRDFVIEHGYIGNKIRVIHNAFVPPEGIAEYEKDSTKFNIITVSRFVPEKDYKSSLQIIKELVHEEGIDNIVYNILGYGEQENFIREYVQQLDLLNYVNIIIDPVDIMKRLLSSDLYLSTSLFEGTSNSLLEAMYAKLPIVATNVGDNQYMVRGNGFLHNIGDIRGMVKSIMKLYNDKSLREQYGIKSREIVEKYFSYEAFEKENLGLFSELMN